MKNSQSNLKSPDVKKNTKLKPQMNEHETYKTIPDLTEPFQPEFTT